MDYLNEIASGKTWDFINVAENKKVHRLGLTLQHLAEYFKEFILEYNELKHQSEIYKSQCLSLKEIQKNPCSSCLDFKTVIAAKNNTIELVAASLTRLEETKNLNIIKEIFKILCGDVKTLTPPADHEKPITGIVDLKKEPLYYGCSTTKSEKDSPSFTERPFNDESMSEIEGTPTGKTSPIIFSKKAKSCIIADKTESGIKKKSSTNWPSPDMKLIKLSYPSPTTTKAKVKLKQSRLNLSRRKITQVVDLTCSPQLKKSDSTDEAKMIVNVKKESLDNDDTIMPSPTSNPVQSNFAMLCKTNSIKNSPCKDKPPAERLMKKKDETCIIGNVTSQQHDSDATHMEESINLLQPSRFKTPKKQPAKVKEPDRENIPQFDTNVSLSILQQVDQIERVAQSKTNAMSPSKDPLAENMNITNMLTQDNIDSSMSLLRRDPFNRPDKKSPAKLKKDSPKKLEPLFKEPTVRKKAEKRALPGWSCDECKIFYAIRYKDDPEMLAKLMEECSKHRGRNNPARPATPPGYWETRWDVPEDTEAFNRRNNAV